MITEERVYKMFGDRLKDILDLTDHCKKVGWMDPGCGGCGACMLKQTPSSFTIIELNDKRLAIIAPEEEEE